MASCMVAGRYLAYASVSTTAACTQAALHYRVPAAEGGVQLHVSSGRPAHAKLSRFSAWVAFLPLCVAGCCVLVAAVAVWHTR